MYIKKSASKKMAMMVLIIAFVFNSAPVRVAGATAGDFTITLTEGGTIVQDSAANGGHYTFSGGVLTILSNNNYTISMTKNTTANRIVVASDATITLSNVKIDVSSVNASNANCAFSISDDSDVQLILSGDNILKSGVNSAGLSVHETSSVTISGEGSLLAESRNYGAGIGSGRAAKSGSITIDDGTITAKGGSEAAGIGGGQNASSGAITINSGFVTATSGSSTTNAIGAGKSGTSDGVTIDDNFVYWLSDEDYLSIPPENAAENSDLSSEIEGYVKLNYAVQQIGFETNIASGASLLMVFGDTPEEYKYDDPTLSVKGDESSGGVKYRWYRSNTLGGPWVFIPDDADGSAYVIPANTPVGDYYYRCVVYSEVGKPVTSNAAHVKVRPTSYRVWFKVDDETPYGTVSAALDSAEQHTSGDLVTQGDAITFTAKPNDANEVYVKQWADDNGPISNATGNTYRIAALSSDVTITVSFAKKTYEVKVTDIDDSASDTKGSGFYPKGDTVSISYAEPHGKRFLGWEVATTSPAGAIVQLQNPGSKNTTFSMPSADVTIKADYEDVYELTYETNNGNISATVDGTLLVKDPATGKAKVSYDKEIVFNVGNYNNPNDALRVIWSVEPMDRTERPKIVAVDEYTYTHPKITSDMALRVNFTERTYSVKVENVKVENVVEETLISAKDPEYVKENSTVTISAEDPKTLPGGLEFIRWDAYRQNSDGSRGAQILGQDFENLKIVNEKLPTTDFTMPGYDVIFVAIFKPYETKVTSVTVVPETAEVPAGGSFSFRANIRGSGNVGGVTWSLGKIYQNTSIDPDTGVLTVGENEIIGTELKIIATSKVDGTKVGTAKVTVVQKKHRVEFRAASAGGIITAIDGNGNPLRNNSQVEHKTTVTFTATPNAEYTVGEWTYNGEVQNETPDENVELSEDLTKLTLTVTTGSAITVKFDGGPGADYGDYKVTVISGGTYPSGDERYDEGDTVEIYADTPPEGQEFSEWTVVEPEDWVLPENSLNTSPTTFTMPGHDVTVRAVFKGSGETPSPTPGGTTPTPTPGGTPTPTGGVNRWQLTVRAESNGRILYDVSGMYAPGARVTITAVPNTGYSFLRWASTNGGAFSNLYSPTTTFTMPNNATTVIAYFTDGDGVYYTEPSYNDASLSSSRLTYDKNGGGNINVRLNAKGYSLLSVTDGVFELEKDHDYILSGNSITLAREFLAGLPLGENTIVFNMSEGADPVLVIDVRDTSRDVLPAVIAVDPTPVSAPENTAGETPPDDATASDVPGEPLPVPVPTPKPTVDVPAPNPADYPALELRVNDIPLAFTGQPPIFKDNTVLIPLREVFENLGYAYEWDAVSATATLTRKNTVITVTEKSYFFEVNGTPYRYGSAYAQTVGGALMVPLSEILKSAGGTVYNDRNSVIRVQILK